jgi:hypothetical protein
MAAGISQPSRIEWDLGGNQHGQPVKLVLDSGRWVLLRDQANQRDDVARIELTDVQFVAIANIAKDAKID